MDMNRKRILSITIIFVPLTLFTFCYNEINAQTRKDSLEISTTFDNDSILFVRDVDEAPRFEGGEIALYDYIVRNLKYPVICRNPEPQGRVVIRFVVNKEGVVSSPTIIRSVDHHLDKEAIRLIESMPKWEPATLDETPVSCYYFLPIVFKLK